MDKTEQLTPKMQKAALLLVAGHGPGEVAKKIGISRTQLHTWRKNDTFIEFLQQETASQLQYARILLMSVAESAVKEISSLMTTSDSDSIRLRAAQTIISETGIRSQFNLEISEGNAIPKTVDGFLIQLGWKEQ